MQRSTSLPLERGLTKTFMKPNYYFDIGIVGKISPDDAPSLVVRGTAFMRLHRFFKDSIGRYAIAVFASPNTTLRVFAESRDDLDDLAAKLDADNWFRAYTHLGYPKAVPDNFAGPWYAFARYKIPTVKSDRDAVDGVSALRNRRMSAADSMKLDYFQIRSVSTGQSFSLIVESIELKDASFGEVNSYGLSTKANLLALPDI